ncbi:MAG: MFS transporter [Spirochaetaceae bacterium]|jgi:EmrB/QacA subfamily drug resistance transporter|nr:MFS transporter [Spirochaetaceae bacterium]
MSREKVTTNHAGILAMAISTALITTYSGSALNLAIPSIGNEFNASASGLTWLVNAYLLLAVCLALPFGKIADSGDTSGSPFNRRSVLISGCALFFIFSTIAVFAPSMPVMLALRIGQGIASAMLFATNIAILVDAFPANQRGKVMGFYAAATYMGISIGPVLGGMLTATFGWRSVFVSMAIICFIAMLCSLIFVPVKERTELLIKKTFKFDLPGVIIFIIALFMLLYGLLTITDSRLAILLIILGLAGCVVFCVIELKTKNPLIDVRIFVRNPNFSLSNLAAMFNYAATFAVSYLMSIYLQEVKGMNAWSAGLFMVCQPVLQAIISPISGRMSDKHSPFILASSGMAVCTVALVCFIFFNINTPLAFVMASLLLTGIGFGLFSSPNQTAIMSSVQASDYSMASSLIATSRNIGDVISMGLISIIMSLQLGGETLEQASKAQIVRCFRIGFIIFTIICAAGVFISLQRRTNTHHE